MSSYSYDVRCRHAVLNNILQINALESLGRRPIPVSFNKAMVKCACHQTVGMSRYPELDPQARERGSRKSFIWTERFRATEFLCFCLWLIGGGCRAALCHGGSNVLKYQRY
jgi:hypothetical protein